MIREYITGLTMNRFQAVYNPSLSKAHIFDLSAPKDGRLTLCEATTAVGLVRGQIEHDKLCKKCLRKLQSLLPENEAITAETIGCKEIV